MTPETITGQKPRKYIKITSKVIKNDSTERTNTPTGLKNKKSTFTIHALDCGCVSRYGYLSQPIRRGGEDVGGQMPPIWTNGFIFVQFF